MQTFLQLHVAYDSDSIRSDTTDETSDGYCCQKQLRFDRYLPKWTCGVIAEEACYYEEKFDVMCVMSVDIGIGHV